MSICRSEHAMHAIFWKKYIDVQQENWNNTTIKCVFTYLFWLYACLVTMCKHAVFYPHVLAAGNQPFDCDHHQQIQQTGHELMFGVLTIPNLSFDSVTKIWHIYIYIHDIHRESQYINDDICQIMSLFIFSFFYFTLVFQPWEFQLFSWFCLWSQASRLPIFLSHDQTLGHLREKFILDGRLWKKNVPETPPKQKNIILRCGGTFFWGVTQIWSTKKGGDDGVPHVSLNFYLLFHPYCLFMEEVLHHLGCIKLFEQMIYLPYQLVISSINSIFRDSNLHFSICFFGVQGVHR